MLHTLPLKELTAGSALIVVRKAGSPEPPSMKVAREGRWLIIDVELLNEDSAGPWSGESLPGEPGGCFLKPGNERGVAHVRSDSQGVFFVANIDLVLRSNGVRALYLDRGAPENFLSAVEHFARLRGYDFARLDDATTAETASASAFLPDLAARVAPGRAALVLIDVQNDFCAPKGATGRGGQPMGMINKAVDGIKALLVAARAAGLFIVHVRAEYGELYRHAGSPYRFPTDGGREPAVWTLSAADLQEGGFFPEGSVEVCRPGTWGAEFVEGITPQTGEAVITKHRFSAFADTGLDLLLRSRGISSLILAGVTTNCCVETTAREAVMRDFYLVVAEDCVAVKDHLRDLHEATLESLGLYFGLVRPSSDIVAQWTRADHDRSRLRPPPEELETGR